jgi:hypothetical protein
MNPLRKFSSFGRNMKMILGKVLFEKVDRILPIQNSKQLTDL